MGDDRTTEASRELSALGTRLREARTKAGFTMAEVAQELIERGVVEKLGKAAVGHWETGHNAIGVLPLKCLAELYQVSVEYLATGRHTEWPFTPELHAAVSRLGGDDLVFAENALRSNLRMESLQPGAIARKRRSNGA